MAALEAVLYSKEGEEKGKIPLNPSLFGQKVNDHLLYEYVKVYRAHQRQGTAKAKGRSEVSGGGLKPWRQKGTGRARSGSNTSPVWVRGGKSHGPRPRSYDLHLSKGKKKGAFLCALSARAGESAVGIIESLSVAQPKTREISRVRDGMKLSQGKSLYVVETFDENLFRAARNLAKTELKCVKDLSPYDVLNCRHLILTQGSLQMLETRLAEKE